MPIQRITFVRTRLGLGLITGATETTVPSTFFALVGVTIRQVEGSSQFTQTGDGVFVRGTGSGQFHLVWQADTNSWFPRSADGYIAATPEPATLLLFGTTAAGLGLARWWNRRRSHGHEHESPSIP